MNATCLCVEIMLNVSTMMAVINVIAMMDIPRFLATCVKVFKISCITFLWDSAMFWFAFTF